MCQTITVDGKRCENFAELRAAVFPRAPILFDQAGSMRDGDCLCPVDAAATAKSLGLVACYESGWDPMDIRLLEPEQIGPDSVRLDDEDIPA